ncbi:MAG: sulfur oxidation c-type cytochrome SoxX [Alphaproteobacteria bacterium]|jgi:sulfur-oxidizing protein SoxX
MRLLGQQLLSVFTLFIFISLTPNVATAMDVKGMMSYKVVGKSIPKSLTGKPGDPKKGLKTAVNRKKGNCLACHTLPNVKQADHGEIGPPLMGVAKRYKEGELRLRLVNPKKLNPDSIMPSYYRTSGYTRVQKKWKGKTIISAQDVEDILAYLKTLNTYQ